ncbi:MAG: hypothetical protein AAFN27_09710 [Pseudomonadota bacterium]
MKILITAAAFVLYTAGATMVYAQGCHKTCADGFTYSSDAGKCVKKTVSS